MTIEIEITDERRPSDYLWSERYERGFPSIEDYQDCVDCDEDEPEDELYKCEDIKVQLEIARHIPDVIVDRVADVVSIEDWCDDDYTNALGDSLNKLNDDIAKAVNDFNSKQEFKFILPTNETISYKLLEK